MWPFEVSKLGQIAKSDLLGKRKKKYDDYQLLSGFSFTTHRSMDEYSASRITIPMNLMIRLTVRKTIRITLFIMNKWATSTNHVGEFGDALFWHLISATCHQRIFYIQSCECCINYVQKRTFIYIVFSFQISAGIIKSGKGMIQHDSVPLT